MPSCRSPSRSTRSETPLSTSMLTVPCSRMPARTVSEISWWLRISITVDSMPALASRWESMSPAGPAPMMATWVVMTFRVCHGVPRFVAGSRRSGPGPCCVFWLSVCAPARDARYMDSVEWNVRPHAGVRPAAVRSPGPRSAAREPAPAGAPRAGEPRRRGPPPCALPAVQHGHRDAPRVRIHHAGQLRITLMGRFAQRAREVLQRQPSGRIAESVRGTPLGRRCGWLAISTSPAEDTCTGMRPATCARLATDPRRDSRSTKSASRPSSTARFTFWFSTCWMSSMNGMAAWRSSSVGELRLTSSQSRRPRLTEPPAPTSSRPCPASCRTSRCAVVRGSSARRGELGELQRP